MKSSNKWSWSMRAVVKSVIILVLAVVIIGPVLTPVVADARDQRDRGRHWRHEPHGRYYWQGQYYDYPPPGYYAPAPPPVYAPPPPPPGITFVFPLHFR